MNPQGEEKRGEFRVLSMTLKDAVRARKTEVRSGKEKRGGVRRGSTRRRTDVLWGRKGAALLSTIHYDDRAAKRVVSFCF